MGKGTKCVVYYIVTVTLLTKILQYSSTYDPVDAQVLVGLEILRYDEESEISREYTDFIYFGYFTVNMFRSWSLHQD